MYEYQPEHFGEDQSSMKVSLAESAGGCLGALGRAWYHLTIVFVRLVDVSKMAGETRN